MINLIDYYNKNDEDGRLSRDNIHRIEFLTTMYLLDKYLPKQSKILDCCAGTGVYAFELAKRGHNVTAGDIVPKHADLMRANKDASLLSDIYCGDVLDMSRFRDESFDAVLCLGALYHLQTGEERERAVSECLRVTRKDGLFIYSYMGALALYFAQFMISIRAEQPDKRLEAYRRLEIAKKERSNGIFYGMTDSEPDEISAHFGLKKISTASVYPLFYGFYNEINDFTPERFDSYMECVYQTCENDNVALNCMHGLYIGKK